jgi:hypothetical protein
MNNIQEFFVDRDVPWDIAKKIAEESCPKGLRIWEERGLWRIQKLLYKKYPTFMHNLQLKRQTGYNTKYYMFVFFK